MKREKTLRIKNKIISVLMSLAVLVTVIFAVPVSVAKAAEGEIPAVRFHSWDNSARMEYTVNVTKASS